MKLCLELCVCVEHFPLKANSMIAMAALIKQIST